MRRRKGLTGLLAVAGVILLPSVATASCGEVPSIGKGMADARTVFVGTVIDVENARRWVRVEVEDVWKGKVGDQAEVRAGPADPPGPISSASSIDRTYKLGETYLFVLWDRTSPFSDSSCSATTRWGPRLAQFDPTPEGPESEPGLIGVPGPESDGTEPETVLRWFVVGFSVFVFVIAMVRSTND